MAKTRVVSYSELDTYRQCRLKHQLAYVERWQPDEVAAALSRGKLFHEVLENHYQGLQATMGSKGKTDPEVYREDYQPTINALLADTQSGSQTEEQELVEWIFDGYRDLYGLDKDWEILAVELAVEEWLPTPKGTRSSFRMKGKVDLLVKDHSTGGGLWVVDHKTCRNLPKSEKDIDLDDQMAIYIKLLRMGGLDIRGAIMNFCRTQKLVRPMDPEERFRRMHTARTDIELDNIIREVYDTFREAYRPREGDPPRSPNPDTCRWRCPFTEACLAGRKGGDTREILSETGYHQDFTRH